MFDIHYGRWCQQNEVFDRQLIGSKGDVYHVHFDQQHGWDCTCAAFKFSKHKTECKHITAAKSLRCTHGWELAAGDPVDDFVGEDHLCPNCHGPSTVVKYAV